MRPILHQSAASPQSCSPSRWSICQHTHTGQVSISIASLHNCNTSGWSISIHTLCRMSWSAPCINPLHLHKAAAHLTGPPAYIHYVGCHEVHPTFIHCICSNVLSLWFKCNASWVLEKVWRCIIYCWKAAHHTFQWYIINIKKLDGPLIIPQKVRWSAECTGYSWMSQF